MTLLLGALTIGLILSLLAMGVFISFRIFEIPDITTDGSITLGASICAILLIHHVDPFLATAAGAAGGAVAGSITAIIHTKFKINALLAGILVMTGLYSVNLNVMGRSNIPLMQVTTLNSHAEDLSVRLIGAPTLNVLGWSVSSADAALLFLAAACAAITGVLLYLFFRTNIGTAMRATGDNQQMIRALGGNVDGYIIMGLAASNGLIALSGALLAQYQGFADAQMGIGMIVTGLASVIIGEALTGSRTLGLTIIGVIIGSLLFRLLIAIALRWGLNPNDLKLVYAFFVFIALISPGFLGRISRRKTVTA